VLAWRRSLWFVWPLPHDGLDHSLHVAVTGMIPGQEHLEHFGTLFTPDVIERSHHSLAARKPDYGNRRTNLGRPRVRQQMVECVGRFAHAAVLIRGTA
jgi:hypothetical protein